MPVFELISKDLDLVREAVIGCPELQGLLRRERRCGPRQTVYNVASEIESIKANEVTLRELVAEWRLGAYSSSEMAPLIGHLVGILLLWAQTVFFFNRRSARLRWGWLLRRVGDLFTLIERHRRRKSLRRQVIPAVATLPLPRTEPVSQRLVIPLVAAPAAPPAAFVPQSLETAAA